MRMDAAGSEQAQTERWPALPVSCLSCASLLSEGLGGRSYFTSQLTYEDHVCLSAVLLTILHDSDKVLNAPDNNQNVLALCKVALQFYIRVACAQDLLNSLCIVLAVCSSGPLCQRSHNRAALLASFDNVIGMSKYLVLYSHVVYMYVRECA